LLLPFDDLIEEHAYDEYVPFPQTF
jgi:hypothetical protein